MLNVPPEFRQKITVLEQQPAVPEPIVALEAFAAEITSELGGAPQLYQLNRARLAVADRHELLRRATPVRSRGKLDAAFNRFYAELFDQALRLQHADLSPPPPVVQPPPEPQLRRRSVAEALVSALGDGVF